MAKCRSCKRHMARRLLRFKKGRRAWMQCKDREACRGHRQLVKVQEALLNGPGSEHRSHDIYGNFFSNFNIVVKKP